MTRRHALRRSLAGLAVVVGLSVAPATAAAQPRGAEPHPAMAGFTSPVCITYVTIPYIGTTLQILCYV